MRARKIIGRPCLWRELTKQGQGLASAGAGAETRGDDSNESGAVLKQLPSRVSIFGISTLPKFYLELMEALAGSHRGASFRDGAHTTVVAGHCLGT